MSWLLSEPKLVPRPIDREGLVIGKCSRQNSPRLILVTPSHQFPLGVTMSLKRRKALIEFAESRDGYILENDYDSEFRFDGPPLPCLQGLDNTGRVIYTGSMSKILYPSLRLGFLVAPTQLVDTLVKVRAIMDQHSPAIDQATLARFITEGFFLSHVQRIRELYAQRRVFFIQQFQKWLGDYFDLEVTPAGLHFVAWLRRAEDLPLFMRARELTGVWPRPLSFFCIKAQLDPAFVFGFAAWSQAQIEQGLAKLASAVKQLKQRGAGNVSSFQIHHSSPVTSPYWPSRRSDQINCLMRLDSAKQPSPFGRTRQSKRLVNATARLWLIREARRRPLDEQLLERRTGLDNRDVVAPRECPIFNSLSSRTALFDIRVGGRRRHDDVRETLGNYDWSVYRTVRRVLFEASLQRFIRTRRQCWTVERRRQVPRCVPNLRAERNRISLLSDAPHRAPRVESLARM